MLDPCCPSADGYADYRDQEQIARGAAAPQRKRVREKGGQGSADADALARAGRNASSPPLVDRWYYIDNQSGTVQGPYASDQMMQWQGAGFFPSTTPVRNGDPDGQFLPLSSLDLSAPLRPSLAQSSAGDAHGAASEEADSSGVEARIAALKGRANGGDDELSGATSIRAERLATHADEGDSIGRGSGVASSAPCIVDEAPPYPELLAAEEGADGPPEYGAMGACDDEPPAYPLDDDEAGDVPYPVDVPYPIDDAYPMDDESGAYPDTDAAYGQADEGYVAPYYTGEGPTHSLQEDQGAVPPPSTDAKPMLNEYKGDRAVVGFIPSNLAVKRSKKEVGETSRKRRKATGANANGMDEKRSFKGKTPAESQKNSIAENYADFMEQVAALK